MKIVPKCKECNFHKSVPIKDYGKYEEHYCHEHLIGTGWQISDGKAIEPQEIKTSPKWCPKR